MTSTRMLAIGWIVLVPGVVLPLGSMAEAKSRAGAAKTSAHKRLVDFVEARGCRIKASPDAVRRMKEIALNGSVTWVGKCERGLISGAGVLQEEGTTVSAGKTTKVAHHWSGSAIKGIRSGTWKRESFAQRSGSQKFWVNVATVVFFEGMGKGQTKPMPIAQLDDYSPGFRRIVADAQRAAEPSKESSHVSIRPSVAEPKLAVTATLQTETLKTEPKPAEAAKLPTLIPRREPTNVVVSRIKASSQYQSYGPDGLFQVKGPGWHAATPIVFPQELSIEFAAPVIFRRLGLLHQERHPERGPRGYMVEVSTDRTLWTLAAVVSDACSPNTSDGWNETELRRPATARFMKLVITSNCGDPNLLTLLGVRVD